MAGSARGSRHEPLKILMTADAVGGVWSYAVDLIRGLVREGAEILVAGMGPRPSPEQRKQLLAMPRVALAESEYALEWMSNPWQDIEAAGHWLLQLAADFRPDIVHLNGYSHANLPWRKPVLITAHSCVFSWWRAVHGCAPGEEWSEYKRRVIEGLAASRAVVCPSAYMADALEQEYGVAREKLHVIHNFSRISRWSGNEKQSFILAAGRIWDPAKNLSLLDQIAPEVKWEIRVAGSERGPENSTAAATNSVQLLGCLAHKDLLKQMDQASIFVHPALYEPFGLSILEAARRQCCLVLSDIPSLRELWTGAAVFADPREPAEWVSVLNRLAEDRTECRRTARLASERANVYRAGHSVSQYWKIYSDLLAQKKEAAA